LTAFTKNLPEDGASEVETPELRSAMDLKSLEELGAFLLAERESQNVSRSEISSMTKITMDQLANIEAGTFTGLAPVYAKGFLRSYAMSLGLDPTDIIASYKKLSGDSTGDPRKPLTTKYKEIELGGDEGISFPAAFLVVLIILAAITLLTIFNIRFHNLMAGLLPFVDKIEVSPPSFTEPLNPQNTAPPTSNLSEESSGEPIIPNAGQVPLNSPPPIQPSSQAARQGTATNESAPNNADAAAPRSVASSAASPQAPASEPNGQGAAIAGGSLYLAAVKPTWVQAVVDNGQIIHLYLKEGDNHTFESAQSVNITTGDGSSLEAFWNGEKLGLLGPARPVEAHFPPPRS
jgi:cytoskeleton protein RodZ